MMKTKKLRKSKRDNTKAMWDMFDKAETNETKVECVYDSKSRDESPFCNECKSILRIGDDGYYCCSNNKCGIIYKDKLDMGAEWRYYGADDSHASDPTRCGMPINPLLVESSFGCKIMCNGGSTYEMRKIKRYTEWQSMPYKEKAKYDDFQVITLMATNSGIPKIIIDDAIRYYDKISQAKTFRGLNRDGLLAASIYISFSINKNPRTSKEIATIFNLDNTSATKGCKNAINILNDLEVNDEVKTELMKSTPTSFIERYCSKLNINNELTKLCLFIAQIVEKKHLIPENTPHSISAGIVYFVCLKFNLNITKKEINSISKISEVTINKCCKKLETFETKLIPPSLLSKYK